jgi:hypothetical protein
MPRHRVCRDTPESSDGFLPLPPVDRLRPFRRALLVRIRLDQARIDGKAFAADTTLFDATSYRHLEQFAQQIAIPETTGS